MSPTVLPATRSARPLPDVPAAGAVGSARRQSVALGLLVSAQLVVMLDTSIVNVALPSIQADLGLGPSGVAWVVNAYVVAFGGLLLLLGRLADLVGRLRMFRLGSTVFTAGTLLCAVAGDEWQLVAGRVVQGAGAAALSPAAMSLLLLTFTGDRRARAMSLWGAASAVGGATGVLVGGLLAGGPGWPSVFLVTVPVSVASVVLAPRLLQESSRGSRRRFDTTGAATITAAVVVLVHSALTAAEHGLTDPGALGGLLGAALLLAVFVSVEGRVTDPLVPLELFRERMLATGVALAVLGGAARASTFVVVALHLQHTLVMSPGRAGLAMVPTSLTGFVVSLALLPRVLRSIGPQRSLVLGMTVLAGGHLWLAASPGSTYVTGVLPGLLLVAVGVALSFTPTTMVVAAAVPATHTGLASGLSSSATQVGAALGTATLTALALTAGGGFAVAFATAAGISLVTASLGWSVVGLRARRDSNP